jgi:ubiquinone/menaquinone biosynthesis C-methylase UbiE
MWFDCIDFFQQGTKNRLFGDLAPLVPPLRLMYDGPRDYRSFKQNGEEYFHILVDVCGLRPSDRVLDIGCGIGRKTLPLLNYVNPDAGCYEGLDVHAPHVEWCKRRIEPRYPYFRFRHVDVWSKLYNPSGRIRASEYRLPFGDCEFDFVILGSVFTHMYSADVRQYIREMSRVLGDGGRGMVTFFLLNDESEALMATGSSTIRLPYYAGSGSRTDNPDGLESAVAHPEGEVMEAFTSAGMTAEAYYGSWCGRRDFLTYQDVVVVRK